MIKRLFNEWTSKTGIPRLLRSHELKNGNYVALYHGVHSNDYKLKKGAQNELLVKQFEYTLDWLAERFHFIAPEALFDHKTKGGLLLTFDDGFKNNYSTVHSILERRKIPAIFFISTQHIQDPRNWLWFSKVRALNHWKTLEEIPEAICEEIYDGMSESELLLMAESPLVTIGAHTVSHPDLPDISLSEAEEEMLRSKAYLEGLINKPIKYFAYPRGLVNKDVIKLCKTLFEAGFAVNDYDTKSKYLIPRISVHNSSSAYLDLKFSPIHKPAFKN